MYPQSEVAPRAALMAAYSYASKSLWRLNCRIRKFLKIYPNHKNTVYAHYLLGLCYYEQIVDEKKDLSAIENSKNIFLKLIENYPDTDFAIDAEFKLDLIDNILAAKEMYVAKYYFERKKWIPSINRYKFVVNNYETTIYVEEAIHRLVEIYYMLGLDAEAKKYANLLGYNYLSSKWYEKTFLLFNKNYKTPEVKKTENSIIKRFKSLFE